MLFNKSETVGDPLFKDCFETAVSRTRFHSTSFQLTFSAKNLSCYKVK